MQPLPTWDEYYLEVAKAVAQRSDAGLTSAGTVIVSAKHRLVSAGFESADQHAELAALMDTDLTRFFAGTAYSTREPCAECYPCFALAGLYRVVWPGVTVFTSWFWARLQPGIDWNALNVNG